MPRSDEGVGPPPDDSRHEEGAPLGLARGLRVGGHVQHPPPRRLLLDDSEAVVADAVAVEALAEEAGARSLGRPVGGDRALRAGDGAVGHLGGTQIHPRPVQELARGQGQYLEGRKKRRKN